MNFIIFGFNPTIKIQSIITNNYRSGNTIIHTSYIDSEGSGFPTFTFCPQDNIKSEKELFEITKGAFGNNQVTAKKVFCKSIGICFALKFSENVSILESQKIYIKRKQQYSLEIHANGEEDMLSFASIPDSSIINFDATKGN